MASVRGGTLSLQGSLKADLIYNVGSQVFLRVATAITALYAARVLGPEQFGVWAVLQVLFMYTAQGHFGTVNAMMREVPVAEARGEHDSAQRIVNSTWGFVTVSSVVVGGCTGAIVLWLYPGADRITSVILGSVWLVVVQLQSVFFQFYCRACSTFKVMALFSTSQGLITLALTWWLVPRLGITGYLIAIAGGFSLILIAISTRPGIRLEFHTGQWRKLLTVGLPMLPGTLMLYLNISMERLALASALSALAVGVFAAAAFVFQFGATIWELVIYTWYSRLAATYGKTGQTASVAAVMGELLPGAIWASSAVQGALYLVLPPLMVHLLPNYGGCVPVAQVLILGMNLWGIGQFLSFALTIIGRQKRSMALQIGFLALKFVALVVAITTFRSVYAVAVASVLALITYACCAWLEWRRLSAFALPAAGSLVVLWLAPIAAALICSRATGTDASFRGTATCFMFYAVAISFGSALLEKRGKMLSALFAWRGAM